MKHVITLLTLLAAITSYLIGSSTGLVALLVSGMLFEGVFWLRIFRQK